MTTNDPQNNLSASEALIGRERIRGATRMIAEGTDAANVTEEQINGVAADLELFLKAHRISRTECGRATGYSASVISDFINGVYRGDRAKVAIDLESWLVAEEARRSRPATTQFVWTNVALEIKSTANYCLDYRKISLVYGPETSGIGKTTALKAIHQELGPRRSALITIDKVDASPIGLLKKICAGLGEKDAGRRDVLFKRAVEALRGRSHLMLLDQIHNLRGAAKDEPLYVLTDLYNATNTAQLWCGTADMVAYLDRKTKRGVDNESLAQIRRRIFPCVDLMESLRGGGAGGSGGGGELLVSVEQVREMFARNKLKLTAAASRFLCELCNQPDSGAIGLCVQIVEYSTMMAEVKNLPSIDLPVLKEAMRRGFTPHRADLLLQRLEVEQENYRAAKVG